MTTVICTECKKHDNIQPIEHPSDKEKVYFKCNDCGAMFDDKGNMAKFIGGEPIPQIEPAKPTLYFGYGKCSRYGCACIAFEADTGASVCNTCHHSYSDHW